MSTVGQRVAGMIARGVVVLADAQRKLQALQLRLTAQEVKDGVEHFEPYGYTSCPHDGAEALVLFPTGDRSHAITVCVTDRRYRHLGLKPGEVAVYTDEGDKLVLKRGRIAELTTGIFRVNASERVELNTPQVVASDAVVSRGALTAQDGLAVEGGGDAAVTVAGTVAVSDDVIAGGKSAVHHRHPETGSITDEPV
ncbi:phage baseplate assembly protein V [Cupriavidus gilardii]|uniref:phage baseplate assembly protein V n=1 Tax=Cupriavidus gilardii TaxID=82541 RepID=UPI000AC3FE0D|nr:phage baseplate assembly protein V [Cupriavidus gilardii]